MAEIFRAELIAEGLVQGVGFRYFVFQHAKILGLRGYVQNRWDGTVLTVAEGDKISIEQLKKYLQTGPMMAHVNNVKVTYYDSIGEFNGFEIR
ncbi:MAG: acylphosphatase [Ignavibacteriae bacterium]|nr:acylphosphatase [Ignavibacteriota bacterium]